MDNYTNVKHLSRAESLLRYIEKSKDISWNSKGELQYKNQVIPLSNIKILIDHAIRNISTKPEGIKLFYQALSSSNVPKLLVANKLGRSLMKKYKNVKKNRWRPPGILDRQ